MNNTNLICYGCLSDNRLLSPLEDHVDLYISLLGRHDYQVSDYINIQLCWECKALLRNAHKFRKQIQTAHHTLNLAKTGLLTTFQSLSHLASYFDDKYFTVEHTNVESVFNTKTEINLEMQSEVLNGIDVKVIKLEPYDIKEEMNDDDYAHNFDSDDENICHKLPERFNTNVRYGKKFAKTIKNNIDLKNPTKYYSKVVLSEEQMQLILEEKRLSSHFLINKNRCELCARGFNKPNTLKKHMAKKHSRIVRGAIKCMNCDYSAPTIYDYDCHKMREHGIYKCKLCNYTSQSHYVMDNHVAIHEHKYQCVQCNLEFVRLSDFRTHYKRIHYSFECDYCSSTFKTKGRIERHIQRIHLRLECKECNKTYRNYHSYQNHLRMSHSTIGSDGQMGTEVAYCVECDKQFQNVFRYKRHVASIHNKSKKKVSYPCTVCGKQFARKNYMRNHYKLYHDTKNNKNYCGLCDKYFVTGYAVRKHQMFVHEKAEAPRNKMCNVCGRGFTTNRVLIHHMRTHTGERPHQCEFCTAAFSQKTALRTHVRARHKVLN